MTRTDNDTWDLASSVGATATMIATARALASRAENPLINDPFAEPLVRAVGIDLFTRLASGELGRALPARWRWNPRPVRCASPTTRRGRANRAVALRCSPRRGSRNR